MSYFFDDQTLLELRDLRCTFFDLDIISYCNFHDTSQQIKCRTMLVVSAWTCN